MTGSLLIFNTSFPTQPAPTLLAFLGSETPNLGPLHRYSLYLEVSLASLLMIALFKLQVMTH